MTSAANGCFAINNVCISSGLTAAVTAIGPTGQTADGPTVTMATGTTGTDFTIVGSGDTLTFNIPSSSALNRGLLTAADWSEFTNKVSSTSIDTSTELDTLVTDDTGSGALVFGTAPTIATPTLTGVTRLDTSTSTQEDIIDNLQIGGTATTTLRADNATSTFAGGINLTSAANGCFAINNVCIGGGAAGAVSSVSNSDGTLTISPTTGAVVASLNLGNSNIWSGLQIFNQASSTRLSVIDQIYIGGTATSTLRGDGATSTFAGPLTISSSTAGTSTFNAGVNITTVLNVSGSASSSFTGGVEVGSGVKANNFQITGSEIAFNASAGATSSLLIKKSSAAATNLFVKAGDSTTGGGGGIGGDLTLEAGHSGGVVNKGGDLRLISGNAGGTGVDGIIWFGSGAFSNTLTEWARFSGTGNLGIGTTSPYATLSVVGETVATNFTATSTTATSTFAGSVKLASSDTNGVLAQIGSGGSATPGLLVLGIKNTAGNPTCTAGAMYYNSNNNQAYVCINTTWQSFAPRIHTTGFTYATSTWSGTTTIFMAPAAAGLTMDQARCETNAGTLSMSLYDGTNRANFMLSASATINTFTYSTNNTFTENESIRADIGTPASSPTKIACRFQYYYTSDL